MSTFKDEFLNFALQYAAAKKQAFEGSTEKSEIKKYTRIADRAVLKLKELYEQGKINDGLHELEELMSHENKYVRHIAATYSFGVNPTLAEKTLEELMKLPTPNIVISDARLSLDAWRRGYLP